MIATGVETERIALWGLFEEYEHARFILGTCAPLSKAGDFECQIRFELVFEASTGQGFGVDARFDFGEVGPDHRVRIRPWQSTLIQPECAGDGDIALLRVNDFIECVRNSVGNTRQRVQRSCGYKSGANSCNTRA